MDKFTVILILKLENINSNIMKVKEDKISSPSYNKNDNKEIYVNTYENPEKIDTFLKEISYQN